ncbi:MAG: hypothetical protein V1646_02575 [bacterium]
MNGLGYKSFFASIAITLFASNSFAMHSADQGLENAAVIQQTVEVLRQDPEATKLVLELKNADDKAKIGLIQRFKEFLRNHSELMWRIMENATLIGFYIGIEIGSMIVMKRLGYLDERYSKHWGVRAGRELGRLVR